jgi:hypothetical protein
MRIQVNHRDGPIHRLERSQNRQNDRVITPHADNAWVRPGIPFRGRMEQDLPVSLLHLFEGMGSVKWCDGNVSAIDLGRASVRQGPRTIKSKSISFLDRNMKDVINNSQSLSPLHKGQHPIRYCSCGLSFPERNRLGCPEGQTERLDGTM